MLVLVNPHVEHLVGRRLSDVISGQSSTVKYGYLINPPQKYADHMVYFCDATHSSILSTRSFMMLPLFMRWIVSSAELYVWARMNGVPFERLRFRGIWKPDEHSVAYVFGRRAYAEDCLERLGVLGKFSNVLCNLSHFFLRTERLSENSRLHAGKVKFLHEANLYTHSEYFRRMFSWYDEGVVVVPFVPADRFEVRKAWADRNMKAVSTGSYHKLSIDPDRGFWETFMAETGLDTLHPLRRKLDESRDVVSEVLEVRNSFFWEGFSTASGDEKSAKSMLGRLMFSLRRRLTPSQSVYFSFDIVDLYNSYAMAVVAEEAVNVPGIGAFEAMAAGAAFVGEASGIYEDLGMKEGREYIGHDGTLEGLISAVRAGLSEPDKVAEIAEQGREFVRRFCNPEAALAAIFESMDARTDQ